MEHGSEHLACDTLTSSGGEKGGVDCYEVSHTPQLL